jgi:Tetraspanin family
MIIGAIGFGIFLLVSIIACCACSTQNKCCLCLNVIFVLIIAAIATALFIVIVAFGTGFGAYLDKGCNYVAIGTGASNIVSKKFQEYINVYPDDCAFGVDPICPVKIINASVTAIVDENLKDYVCTLSTAAKCDNITTGGDVYPYCTAQTSATEFKNIQEAVNATNQDCYNLMYVTAGKKYSSITASLLGWLEIGSHSCSGICNKLHVNYFSDANIEPAHSCKDELKELISNNLKTTWIVALVLTIISILSVLASFFLCCHPNNTANSRAASLKVTV